MKAIYTVFSIIILLIVFILIKPTYRAIKESYILPAISGLIKENKKEIVGKELVKYFAELNKQLPVMINEDIRWDAALKSDDLAMYFYTNISDYEYSFNKSAMTKQICNTKEMRQILDSGLKIKKIFKDINGKTAAEIMISESDCHKMNN